MAAVDVGVAILEELAKEAADDAIKLEAAKALLRYAGFGAV